MEHEPIKYTDEEIEDGEISDSDDAYTPLQRPILQNNDPQIVQVTDSSIKMDATSEHDAYDYDDESLPEHSSDSSTILDNNSQVKRLKKKINKSHNIKMAHSLSNVQQNNTAITQQQSQSNKINQKKYNIWTDSLQEEALLENLKGCDVNSSSNQLSSNIVKRSVESYNYTLKYRLEGDNILKRRMSSSHSADELIIDNCFTASKNKRFRNNFNKKNNVNVRLRLGSCGAAVENKTSVARDANSGGSGSSSCGIIGGDDRIISDDSSSNDSHGNMFQSRCISDLSNFQNCTDEDIARDIANKLYEENDDLLLRIVNTLGRELSIKLFKETQNIESSGGMLIMNRQRRRTPGGVFLFLVKNNNDITKNQMKEIFVEETKRAIKNRKKMQAIKRDKKVEELKKSLTVENDLPMLSTRSELISSRLKPEMNTNLSNPPPSPVTDCNRENSSDFDTNDIQHVNITTPDKMYPTKANTTNATCDDDDVLDMRCDEMDLW